GPEFPPPTNPDELDVLVLEYWKQRQASLNTLILKLVHQQESLKRLEQAHSLPLQQMSIIDTEQGKRKGYKRVDTSNLDIKIGWVQDDLKECAERVEELVKYHEEKSKNVQQGGTTNSIPKSA